MSLPSTFFTSPNNLRPLAALMSYGCLAAYDTSGAYTNFLRTGYGATYSSYTLPTSPLAAPFGVFGWGNGVVTVHFAGIQSLRQGLVYYMNSGLVTNTAIAPTGALSQALISNYLTKIAAPLRAEIVAAAQGASQIRVILTGHSMGSSTAVAAFAHLHTTPLTGVTYLACYGYGGPRLWDQAFVDYLMSINPKTFFFSTPNDPIPRWPTDLASSTVQMLSSGGGVIGMLMNANRYADLPTLYSLDAGGGTTSVASYGSLSLADQIATVRAILSTGELPVDHACQTYVNRLAATLSAYIQQHHVPPIRQASYDVAAVAIPDQPAPVDITVDHLPTIASMNELPSHPAGSTLNLRPNVVIMTRPPIVNGREGLSRRPRVASGDGKSMKKIFHILSDLRYISRHDAGVESGTKKGSMVLGNPVLYTQEVQEALAVVQRHLQLVAAH